MNQSLTTSLVLLLALIAANLPFFSKKLFLLLPVKSAKSLGLRLLELVVYYFLVGFLAYLFENRAGRAASQGWEFYAITGAVFLTMAFPSFVYRYLLKHRD